MNLAGLHGGSARADFGLAEVSSFARFLTLRRAATQIREKVGLWLFRHKRRADAMKKPVPDPPHIQNTRNYYFINQDLIPPSTP